MRDRGEIVKKSVFVAAVAVSACCYVDSFDSITSGNLALAQARVDASSRSANKRSATVKSPEAQAKLTERYRKILLNNPGYGAAFDHVYRAAVQLNGADSWVEELRKDVEKEKGALKGKRLYLLGLVYLRREQTDEAATALADAELLLPDNGSIPDILGRTLILQGRLQEGCDALERALNKNLSDSERVETLEKLGGTYAKLGLREKAENVWNSAIEKSGDNVDVLRAIAEIQADSGLYRQARELFAKLEKNAREKKDVQAEIEFAVACGDMQTRLGEKDAAIEDFERALDKLAPSHWLFKSLRDRVEYAYLLRSDYDGLVEHYRARIEKRPNDVDAIRRLVVTLGSLARYDDAENLIETARKRAPKDVDLCRSALELATARNDFQRAYALYVELDSLTSLTLDECLAWGDVALKNDDFDTQTKKNRAVELWTRTLKQANVTSASALLVADKLIENGFDDDAEMILKKLVANDKSDFEPCSVLARFYLKKDAREKAFDALDNFAKENAKDPATFDKRANFLRDVGYAAEATDAARKAVEATPGDFRRVLYLCDCEANANGVADEQDLKKAEELALTDGEKEQVFTERLRFVRAKNVFEEYLGSLDKQLADAQNNSERADLFWKKTAVYLAFDDPNGATDVTIQAIQANAVSKALANKIQEIVAKSQAPDRTLDLLNLAIENDKTNAALYLRSRARVCLELGKADEAIESGKKLLEYDSGLAENYRVYAEVLLECGRYDDAIDVLRRAAFLNSADRMSQLKLAGLLDDVGKTDEAIDILWNVFDASARLEEKLTLIDSLSKFSAKLEKFDALKERLQNSAKTTDARRENAYCLARAYMSLKDYDSARTTLENTVAFMGARTDDSSFWLHALSNLAELQNDIEGAIRFQEQLCELDDSTAERNRLLALYRRTGDTARARDYLVKKILPTEPLWKRLETVDTLLAFDDYPLAGAILDDLSKNFPDSWEIVARRLTIAGWTKEKDLPNLIEQVLARKDNWNTKSSKTAAVEFDCNTNVTTISGDAWAIGSIAGRAVNQLVDPQDYRDLAAQTLLVVYRDKLALKDKKFLSASTTVTQPQKPIPAYITFGAARFEALAWKERLARDENSEITASDEGNDEELLELTARYLRDAYELYAQECGIVKDAQLNEKDLSEDMRSTALALAKKTPEWRVEAFASVLNELVKTNDPEKIQADSAFLVDALQASFKRNRFKNDSSIWKQASYAAAILNEKGDFDGSTRVRDLIKLAGSRDYSILLNVDSNEEYAPFEAFVETWKSAEQEVLRQTHNKADVERARETLGSAALARLQIELKDAFKKENAKSLERLNKNGEHGKTLVEKVVFGHFVVNSFISLNRRDLFDFEPTDALTPEAVDDFEKRLYRLLDFVIEADSRLVDKLDAKAGNATKTADLVPVVNALGYFERIGNAKFTSAAYLIDKTLYDSSEPRSIVETGRVFEFAFGTLFTLDLAQAPQETQVAGNYEFERLARFEEYIAKKLTDSSDVRARLYAQALDETIKTLESAAKGEVLADSIDDLKEKALENVVTLGEKNPASAPLLVALAMLATCENDEQKALEYIEKVSCVGFTEQKARELAILGAFKTSTNQEILARCNDAIRTLSGARLDEEEASRFWTCLKVSGRDEEALNIRRRLETFASSDRIVEAMLDDILEGVEKNVQLDDADVAFALRVFKIPSTSLQSGGRLVELRAKALAALNSAGKLKQTLEKLESQVANAPGAYEMALRLADVKVQLGELDGAKTLLGSLDGKTPNDPAILFDYASVLARAGELDKAKGVLTSIYNKKLEEFFKRNSKPDFWTFDDDLAFIERTDYAKIAPYAYYAFSILLNGAEEGDETVKQKAYDAIERLWKGEGAAAEDRETLHSSAGRLLAMSEDSKFFPMLSDYFVESLVPNEKENMPYPAFQEIHRIAVWNDRAPNTLSLLFLQLADPEKDSEALNVLLKRIDDICDAYEKRPNESPVRHSAALVLDVMIRLRLRMLDSALEKIDYAEQFESFCAPEFTDDPLALGLAFERFVEPNERQKADDVLLKYYLKGYEVNTHIVYAPYYISRIYPVGMRSKDQETCEKYTRLALKKMQEVFRLAAKADLTSDRRVGGSMETVDTIKLYAETLADAFDQAGKRDVVKKALEESGLAARLDKIGADSIEQWKELFDNLKTRL